MVELSRRSFLRGAGTVAVGLTTGGCGQSVEAISALPEVVRLQEKDFPLKYPTAEEFIGQALKCVDRLVSLLGNKESDPFINPDLSALRWFKEVKAGYFNPPTLLQLLKRLSEDIKSGFVVLEAVESDYPASQWTETFINPDDDVPHLNKTHILLSKGIQNECYPDLHNPSKKVTISNLGITTLLLYEYGGRLQKLASLIFLRDKEKKFEGVRDLTPEIVNKAIETEEQRLFDNGYRRSRDQNVLQLALARSIAAIAGNPQARVVGLERQMDWAVYKAAVGSGCLSGDLNKLVNLIELLTCSAKY